MRTKARWLLAIGHWLKAQGSRLRANGSVGKCRPDGPAEGVFPSDDHKGRADRKITGTTIENHRDHLSLPLDGPVDGHNGRRGSALSDQFEDCGRDRIPQSSPPRSADGPHRATLIISYRDHDTAATLVHPDRSQTPNLNDRARVRVLGSRRLGLGFGRGTLRVRERLGCGRGFGIRSLRRETRFQPVFGENLLDQAANPPAICSRLDLKPDRRRAIVNDLNLGLRYALDRD